MTDLPTTPADALRWAADRLDPEPGFRDSPPARALRRWAAELDAAPATYALPEPPPEVVEVWDRDGDQWDRYDVYNGWSQDSGSPGSIWPWSDLLANWGPLSTVPPERGEVSDAG